MSLINLYYLLKDAKNMFPQGEFTEVDKNYTEKEYNTYFAISRIFQPKSILEVGAYTGISAASMILGSLNLEYYLGLDSQAYIKNSNEIAKYFVENVIKDFLEINPKMGNIKCEWKQIDTFREDITNLMKDKSFDWIHLDGAHEYDEARKDILQFWPYVTPGKLMTIHDYDSHPTVRDAVDDILKEDILKDIDYKFVFQTTRTFMSWIKKEK
jgi:hypothetical protein